jgi:uncharacterized surface protein with fasciclin (FAS1) repeats
LLSEIKFRWAVKGGYLQDHLKPEPWREFMKIKYIAITLPIVMMLYSCEVVDTYIDELHDIEHQREETVSDNSGDQDKTLYEITKNNHDFSILAEAVQHADLQDSLDGDTPYTLFAPTDDAFQLLFKELDISAEEFLTGEYSEFLKNTLLYHILPGLNRIEELLVKKEIQTLKGEILQINRIDDQIFVGHDDQEYALIVNADVIAGNGVMHIVELVLTPSGDAGDRRDSGDEDSLPDAGDDGDQEPEDPDEEEEAPGEEETDPGQDPDEGDSEEEEDTAEENPTDETDFNNLTLMEILGKSSQFSIFREAIQVAGHENVFYSGSQNTILVPTNRAFQEFLKGSDISAEELLSETNREFLENLILYHIIPGNRDSSHFKNSKRIRTANQSFVDVVQEDGQLSVGNHQHGFAKIIELDIGATNGIIHVIDAVLIP